MMRKIFICYRRAEAEYVAGALGRDLRRYFGEEQVFRDKEDIGGGIAWRQHVLASIDGSSALLVLIGKDWINARDEKGTRRLDDPYDPVRTEILDGGRDGAAIFPILLDEGSMPRASDLPVDLRQLSELTALRLRDGDWHADLDRICKTLEKVGFVPNRQHGHPSKPRGMPIKLMVSQPWVAIVGALFVLVPLILLLKSEGSVAPHASGSAPPDVRSRGVHAIQQDSGRPFDDNAGEPTRAPTRTRVAPSSVAASTFFARGSARHPPEHAFDSDPSTAWNEGTPGPGRGEWIEARFVPPRQIRGIKMATGYDAISPKYGDLFTLNAHARRVHVLFDGVQGPDRRVEENVRLVEFENLNVRATAVRFVFDEVWTGTRWEDLCVSEIEFYADE